VTGDESVEITAVSTRRKKRKRQWLRSAMLSELRRECACTNLTQAPPQLFSSGHPLSADTTEGALLHALGDADAEVRLAALGCYAALALRSPSLLDPAAATLIDTLADDDVRMRIEALRNLKPFCARLPLSRGQASLTPHPSRMSHPAFPKCHTPFSPCITGFFLLISRAVAVGAARPAGTRNGESRRWWELRRDVWFGAQRGICAAWRGLAR